MTDLKISEMLILQKKLWEEHKDTWMPLEPEHARNTILWIIEELGEAIAIIKKRGEHEIINDYTLRKEFIFELVDVYMYLNDVLLRYNISPEEFSAAYIEKHNKNIERDFEAEYNNYRKQY